ncbi:MAG: 6-phosphofructokinase, partial [Lachnospiraceae bacterium]|nr:6-phosphofructokinase [Lachnospiraceae bacterium]
AASAAMILKKEYGYMVAIKNGVITKTPLSEVAGKLKMVNPDDEIIKEAEMIGISFGNK